MKIESLTHLGTGKAEDGTIINAPVVPGEVIELKDDGSARIITPSVERVKPSCPHIKTCGGCTLQHASDAFVAQWKQHIVQTALHAHGLEAAFRPLHTSPPQSRRRAKLTGRRTKKGTLLGFHARRSDTVVDTPHCELLTPSLRACFPALEAIIPLSCTRKGEVGFAVTQSNGGVDVLIQTQVELTSALRQELTFIAQKFNLARVAWNDELIVECQPPMQLMGVAQVAPPAGAFLQATHDGQDALTLAVSQAVLPAKRLVDLFSGVGTFTLPLAQHSEVHAFEGDSDMIAALDKGWRRAQGLKRVDSTTRDLFRRPLEVDELNKFDAAVIDPPRAGALAQIKTLAESNVSRLAMASCNPITFARDAALLVAGGYTLNWVQTVDQFRWSPHVELVASFSK